MNNKNILAVISTALLFFFTLVSSNAGTQASSRYSCNSVMEDNDIDMQIKMLYQSNDLLKGYALSSETKNRVVSLRGTVNNEEESRLAEDLASLVDYIRKIDNQIVINHKAKPSPQPLTASKKLADLAITSLVKSNLLLEPKIKGLKIHVVTYNHITILTGFVNSNKEKKLAHKIASHTKGVVAVKNNLKINHCPQTKWKS